MPRDKYFDLHLLIKLPDFHGAIHIIWSWAYFYTEIFMIFLIMLKIYRDIFTMYFSAVLPNNSYVQIF